MAVTIFLSTVSDEFRLYRDQLRTDLTRHNVEVKVQQDFKDLGGDTLDKLDVYIAHCDAVVHLVGALTGSDPGERELSALLAKYPDLTGTLAPLGEALWDGGGVSYTQWEAWLALYHSKRLLIAKAAETAERGPNYAPTKASRAAQAAHLARLETVRRFPGCEFTSPDNLAKHIFSTAIVDLLAKAKAENSPRQPRNLPFASLGSLFKGRDAFLDRLREGLVSDKDKRAVALHGLGGIGKTRLAVEYALRHASEYSALLFVSAETAERLNAGLAALAAPDILDLPQKDAPQDELRISAALKWLDDHPGWLMILDNVDDAIAAAAVEKLLARLRAGQVIVTGRISNFSPAVRKLELGVLDIDAASAFLLERTLVDRDHSVDDAKLARVLATELAGLALGLEQAGAYIATERTGFARYLALWRERRETVLNWFDKDLISYNHEVGLVATWVTSVERLTPEGRRLLERLAYFAPEPIPDSLLNISITGENPDFDLHKARSNLYAFSLASRANVEDGKASGAGFVVHRLVQDFTKRGMREEHRRGVLKEALDWMNEVFTEDPEDVRTWPILDPLTLHAFTLAHHGDEAGIAEPTAHLYNELGLLFKAKARYAEAEQLMQRALAIGEASYGPHHPNVATRLNNLAELLRATNGLVEAEPLIRRALAIAEASCGPDHPAVALYLNNLVLLLMATNRVAEAEPLMQRALAISEASNGPHHPNVATRLNNLAELFHATNRLAEAEPLIRRALAITEASYGPDHPMFASGLNNLAGLLSATNRLAEAERLMRRALEIDEASYASNHPRLAVRLYNLAGFLYDGKRFGEAEPLYRRALAIDEASYGPDHPNVANDLWNLAELLFVTNRLVEAEPLYRRALAIDEASHGPDHADTLARKRGLLVLAELNNSTRESKSLITPGRVGRNQPCPCGSGKKYKRCHGSPASQASYRHRRRQ
jgi:tetratricopeptide (TPR) repeat protein